MSNTRVHGGALVIGAALLFAAQVANHLLFAGSDLVHALENPRYLPVPLLSGVGALLWMWGLPLFAAARIKELGRWGALGTFLLVGVAAVCSIVFGLVGAVVSPYLTEKASGILTADAPAGIFLVVILGTVACLIGSASLAISLSMAPSRADRRGRGRAEGEGKITDREPAVLR